MRSSFFIFLYPLMGRSDQLLTTSNPAVLLTAHRRFNVLHTATDVNFDRIAYLTKLIFRTKISLIALIDGEKQWHKAECELRCYFVRCVRLSRATLNSLFSSWPHRVIDQMGSEYREIHALCPCARIRSFSGATSQWSS